ncbi:aminopeptidase [Pyxidicoccus fallax]|uniref:M1 family metallopeptidase n=1 Tax=Pyxidicoccus fallax TaxID=394095 RepID=A0A848LT04_9BACT|nr:M1 family aminopeptidase [Pyxidicoccus fallax]NMO20752.1 M1 family metallopeptidase [Pyxidicoccus fallax]NPC83226.1 aminopeptidase [Pyxidicoccus fallax]
MRTFLRGCLLWCALSGAPAWSGAPPSPPAATPAPGMVSPEVQLCLQHLKPSERERAAKALGPLAELPLYRVRLEVDPAAREVKGQVQVEVVARGRPLTELYLRLTPNMQGRRVTLSEAKLGGKPVRLEQPEPTLYRVSLEEPVPAGAAASLEVAVKATVPRAEKGGGMLAGLLGGGQRGGGGDHGAFSATEDFLSLVGVVPQVPPVDAAGRPWDGPQGIGDLSLYEPANVLATVSVPTGWTVHATGAPMGEVPERDGRVRFAFAAGAVRDFPILVSRGYEKKTTTVGGVTVESHFAARDKAAGQRVLEYTAAALAEFERRLGPLPYTHFRVVEAPLSGGAGGMEFPGLVTVATSLYRGSAQPSEALSSLSGMEGMEEFLGLLGQGGGNGALAHLGEVLERTLEFTVAHEVAHQYFAGLIGSDPINAPVVDESLAQYAALLYVEWRHGKAAADVQRKEALVASYHLYRLSGGKDGKADRPTGDFENEFEYGALVYGKAPLLHHASRQLVGDDAFFRGLRSYVDTYRFKWTCGDCLTKELAKASPANAKRLDALRVRWWSEAHGDADLGKADLGSLLGAQGLGDLGDLKDLQLGMDPASKKLLEELMPGLLGE